MKLQYKHIHFEDISYIYPGRKTKTFLCINNSEDVPLGDVRWDSPWRQYCFFPKDQIALSKSCCDDVSDFIGQLRK